VHPATCTAAWCAALRTFLEEGVDVAVMEVGLGGRLDATNCVRAPVVCGVTALGFDHMDILGHTLPVTHCSCPGRSAGHNARPRPPEVALPYTWHRRLR
jgi:hypothetical protein